MRVGNSQTITRGSTGRTGTRRVAKHMVKHVYAMEGWRRNRIKTPQKGSLYPRKKSTSTHIEWKYKGRVDETTRTLGTHRKAIQLRTTTNGKDTIGHDSKVPIRKKLTKDTG